MFTMLLAVDPGCTNTRYRMPDSRYTIKNETELFTMDPVPYIMNHGSCIVHSVIGGLTVTK